jgi:hypothetical protein
VTCVEKVRVVCASICIRMGGDTDHAEQQLEVLS